MDLFSLAVEDWGEVEVEDTAAAAGAGATAGAATAGAAGAAGAASATAAAAADPTTPVPTAAAVAFIPLAAPTTPAAFPTPTTAPFPGNRLMNFDTLCLEIDRSSRVHSSSVEKDVIDGPAEKRTGQAKSRGEVSVRVEEGIFCGGGDGAGGAGGGLGC